MKRDEKEKLQKQKQVEELIAKLKNIRNPEEAKRLLGVIMGLIQEFHLNPSLGSDANTAYITSPAIMAQSYGDVGIVDQERTAALKAKLALLNAKLAKLNAELEQRYAKMDASIKGFLTAKDPKKAVVYFNTALEEASDKNFTTTLDKASEAIRLAMQRVAVLESQREEFIKQYKGIDARFVKHEIENFNNKIITERKSIETQREKAAKYMKDSAVIKITKDVVAPNRAANENDIAQMRETYNEISKSPELAKISDLAKDIGVVETKVIIAKRDDLQNNLRKEYNQKREVQKEQTNQSPESKPDSPKLSVSTIAGLDDLIGKLTSNKAQSSSVSKPGGFAEKVTKESKNSGRSI